MSGGHTNEMLHLIQIECICCVSDFKNSHIIAVSHSYALRICQKHDLTLFKIVQKKVGVIHISTIHTFITQLYMMFLLPHTIIK